jgi:hypothetical protein
MVIHGFKKLQIRKFQSILSLFQLEYNQMLVLIQAEIGAYKIGGDHSGLRRSAYAPSRSLCPGAKASRQR